MKTHFERVLKHLHKYGQEGRKFAKKAILADEPSKVLSDFIEGSMRKLAKTMRGDKDLIHHLLPLNAKAMIFAHCIMLEIISKQQRPYSFAELIKNPELAPLVAMPGQVSDEASVNAAGHMQYQMASHSRAGRQVYEVSAGLADRLRHTELRGLHADDLQLPHPSIYIKVPPAADLKIWNEISSWHDVVGIYVTEDDMGDLRAWRFLVCGESKPIALGNGIVDDNDALVYFHIPLPKEMLLKDALLLCDEHTKSDMMKNASAGKTFNKNEDEWRNIFQWAMNVVLYATMEGAELEKYYANRDYAHLHARRQKAKSPQKRKRINDQIRSLDPIRRIALGRSISINREGWELTVRVRVDGHWRNQPYGPGRMYRRRQWIEPYWKGPEDGSLARAVTNISPSPQESRTGAADDTGNGTGDPTFERVVSLPTEGVDEGNYHVDGSDDSTG